MPFYVYNCPENKLHHETPVRFSWMPTEDAAVYSIQVYTENGAIAYQFDDISINFFTPPVVMEPGTYTYSVFSSGVEFVSRQRFAIAPDAVQTPLRERKNRYQAIGGHPRIWLQEKDVERLKQEKDDRLHQEWNLFITHGVTEWLTRPVHKQPNFYKDNKRVISVWRKMYMDCQEALYAVQHCAVAYRVTGEEQYLEVAKKWLLAIAEWNTQGATARSYNDEAAFRITTALAWGYDWLYETLLPEERAQVKAALLVRGRELFRYVTQDIKIHIKLLDSHGVRSLSMTLIPAALALFGEEPEAEEWLNYTIEYFYTLFTPWGGEDGGWAEGCTYWQTGVTFFAQALCLIKKATGLDIFKRPFFQNTGDFPLYACGQDTRFMGFGDMSDLGEFPGLKAGYTMRILSAVSHSPNAGFYAWYFAQAKARRINTDKLFYNYGWWNFYFDDLFFKMLFEEIPAKTPPNGVMMKHFRDIGWVCLHRNLADEKEHIAFLFKSSPYGAVSHSHGDQNAFVLHAFGQPLAIQSGYYVGFWSDMHIQWRRQTKSKNAVLIDGIGQFAEMQKNNVAEALNGSGKSQYHDLIGSNGKIEACEQLERYCYIRGDALNAYQKANPQVKCAKRHVLFVAESVFVIIDEISTAQKANVDWLLHGLAKFQLLDNECHLQQEDVNLKVLFGGEQMKLSQTCIFDGVPEEETAEMPMQWHLKATTAQPAEVHTIVSLLYPYKTSQELPLQFVGESGMRFSFDGTLYNLTREGEQYRLL